MSIENSAYKWLVNCITNLNNYKHEDMMYYLTCVRPLCEAVYSQSLEDNLEQNEEQTLSL